MRLNRFSLSRRQLLAGGTAFAAAGFTSPLAVLAKAPKTNTQAPYFYRFKLGDIEATVVSDGVLSLGEPAPVLPNFPKEEIAKLLTDNFLAPEAGCGDAHQDAGHVGFEQDSGARLSLSVARHRPCLEAG